METKWLEDFVSLAETRSFSQSAQLRYVTQPAFSQRIQSLEAWAGPWHRAWSGSESRRSFRAAWRG
jgi:hypothetical protein